MIFFIISFGLIVQLSKSISANTGFAPSRDIVSAVDIKEKGVVIISSFLKYVILFDKIISIKQSDEKKHLIIFKKALFNLDNFTENQMLETLSPVINSDSVWKAHGLLLMAEFYLDKKEFIKSKEFFTKVSEIENLNQNIKQDVQKKLSREFSE